MTYISPSLQNFNEEWLDVDFQKYGSELCGWIPSSDREMLADEALDCATAYGSVMPVYTRTEIREHIRRLDAEDGWRYRRIVHKKNQGNEGTCVYNMGAHILQNTWNIQFGDHNAVALSPISGYRWNAPNSQVGSTVGGCIRHLTSHGLLPTRNVENQARFQHTHPDTGYYTAFQSGWQSTAAHFRAHEWMYLKTPEEWWSAIINGHGAGGGRNRHAIAHFGLALDGNNILSIYLQSWYTPWGFTLETSTGPLTSFGADSEASVRTMVARDGWAIRTVRRPPFI